MAMHHKIQSAATKKLTLRRLIPRANDHMRSRSVCSHMHQRQSPGAVHPCVSGRKNWE